MDCSARVNSSELAVVWLVSVCNSRETANDMILLTDGGLRLSLWQSATQGPGVLTRWRGAFEASKVLEV